MSEPPIRVLLIEDNAGDERLIQEFLSEAKDVRFDLARSGLLSAGLARLEQGGIDIVLLDLALPDSQGLETFRRVREQGSGVPIVIVTGLSDDALAMQAVREGAQDYLVKGSVKAQALIRVIRYTIERHRAQNGQPAHVPRSLPGRIVGFMGAKGGVGTTTVVLNVAAALAGRGHSVTLMEAGPGWGAFSFLLNHTPAATLAGALALPPERINSEALGPLLYRAPSGPRILFGAQRAQEFQEVEPAAAEALVTTLAGMADYALVDLPAYPCRANAAIVPRCDQIVLVAGRLLGSVVAGSRALDLLARWGARPGTVSAVLVNRSPLTSSVQATEPAAQLPCDTIVVVPNASEACMRAQKSGLPLVVSEPGIPASARLMQLAEWLVAQRAAAGRTR